MTHELTLYKKDGHQDRLMNAVKREQTPAPAGVDAREKGELRPAKPTSVVRKVSSDAADSNAPQYREMASEDPARQLRSLNSDRRQRDSTIIQRQRYVHFLPPLWHRMGTLIAASCCTAMIIARMLVSPLVGVLMVVALLMTLIGVVVAKWEGEATRPLGQILGATMVFVVAPHALAGLGYAIWIIDQGLDIRLGLGALVAISAVSAALLKTRIPLLFVSLAATWAPLALIDGSLLAIGAVVLVVIVMFVVSHLLLSVDNEGDNMWRAQERARDRYEDFLRDFEDAGQGWFWETDRRGLISYVSPIVACTVGQPRDDLVGRPFLDLFDLTGQPDEKERTVSFHMSGRSAFQELALRVSLADEERWWCVSGRPVHDDYNNFVGFRGSGTDLTEKRRSQQTASRLAHYDSLTGLANRFQMAQTLKRILGAPRETERQCGVLLLDLDRFKQVNDSFGHPIGDALLKQVAQRLELSVGEAGKVGRLGGDEFKIIIPGRADPEKLGHLAYAIIHSLSQPYLIDGYRVIIGASIGSAVSPRDGITSEALIRSADLALYAAKDGGRGRYHFYSSDLHSAAEERAELERDLRDAIAQRGLELYYQPVVQTSTERITGFEALLRWNHPVKGWVSPEKFLPIAEDTGLISAIGEWSIRRVCQDLALWPEHVCCAINISPLQFSDPQLPAMVTRTLEQSGVSAGRLELEITESVFLNDGKISDATFAALKAIGVRLVLDDFGTGYSSLAYLKKAPFDRIKIDHSFVCGAAHPGSRNGAIIAAITSLAKALDMDTTAEGVETMDELDLVRLHGCSHVQGYIYERPLSAVEAHARLRSGLASTAVGPRSARLPRQTLVRKVVLEHDGEFYDGTIRNISALGAMIEGLWNVPAETIFQIAMSECHTVTAVTRWGEGERMGVEFSEPLECDEAGNFVAIKPAGADQNFLALSDDL